jgi:hypothetical protein
MGSVRLVQDRAGRVHHNTRAAKRVVVEVIENGVGRVRDDARAAEMVGEAIEHRAARLPPRNPLAPEEDVLGGMVPRTIGLHQRVEAAHAVPIQLVRLRRIAAQLRDPPLKAALLGRSRLTTV